MCSLDNYKTEYDSRQLRYKSSKQEKSTSKGTSKGTWTNKSSIVGELLICELDLIYAQNG